MDPAGAVKERSIPTAAARAKAPGMESPALCTGAGRQPLTQHPIDMLSTCTGLPPAELAAILGHRDE
jgi:hypothetical protein